MEEFVEYQRQLKSALLLSVHFTGSTEEIGDFIALLAAFICNHVVYSQLAGSVLTCKLLLVVNPQTYWQLVCIFIGSLTTLLYLWFIHIELRLELIGD
ncbi:Methionine import ATP-binding MetN 1 [Gossypium arboreum]|uniref:Methionine import ATP-binding MetN 1 n=2 Tax=Gossypium arboreum TaxID=29729 RepID=A0A0B0N965_GOSAR|nr:hypothetical protein PVK06_012255 [Gossypium arboreum]KHG09197.1 Methionine import ATP-binding MetN 1 [Gossypium arboreum]